MSVTILGGIGRPDKSESQRRQQEFIRLLAAGRSFKDAAAEAKVKPERALVILWEQRELCHLDEAPLSKAA